MDATGAVIQSFAYSNSSSWPQSPHGQGPSLTVINVDGDYNLATNWRASYAALGTPGYNEGVDTVPTAAPYGPPGDALGLHLDLDRSGSGHESADLDRVDRRDWSTSSSARPARAAPIEQIGTSSEANYVDSGLVAGTTYYYQICGVNAVGSGPFSGVLSVTVPAVPADPTAAAVTSVTCDFDLADLDRQRRQRRRLPDLSLRQRRCVRARGQRCRQHGPAPSSVSYTDTSLTPGVIYAYEIVAYNISGTSDPTDVTNTTLLAAPDLVFSQRNGNSATLFFSEPTGATSYNIYRGTASGQETLLASNVSGSPYTDSTLQTGVTYYYYVTAVNANASPAPNESAPSNETSPSTGGGAFQWTGDGSDNNWTTPGQLARRRRPHRQRQ